MNYRTQKQPKTSIRINEGIEGETIEMKVERIVNNKEPITDGAPIIFQERSEGVQAAYDIRTDRFELAVDAMDYVNRSHTAKREDRAKLLADHNKKTKGGEDGKPETIQGQSSNTGGETTQ